MSTDEVPEIDAAEVASRIAMLKIIDVRRADEFNAYLGHIAGAQLATLGPDLLREFGKLTVTDTVVFVCHSGVRSLTAAVLAMGAGLPNSFNMRGGMVEWNRQGLPIEINR